MENMKPSLRPYKYIVYYKVEGSYEESFLELYSVNEICELDDMVKFARQAVEDSIGGERYELVGFEYKGNNY